MRSRTFAVAFACVVALIGSAAPVAADPPTPGTEWQAIKDRGNEAWERNDFVEALRLYREATVAQHRAHRAEQAILSFNIALAYQELGRVEMAWRRFAQLARQSNHPGVARAAADKMEALRAARESLPTLTVDCQPGLHMRVATPDGHVLTTGRGGWIPCEEHGSPWIARVPPGDYAIRVRAGSYESSFDLQMAAADQHHHVYLPAPPSGGMCAGRPGH